MDLRDIVASQLAKHPHMTTFDTLSIVNAMEGLWRSLESAGWVDTWGGMESRRVVPATLDAIHKLANPLASPDQDVIDTLDEIACAMVAQAADATREGMRAIDDGCSGRVSAAVVSTWGKAEALVRGAMVAEAQT